MTVKALYKQKTHARALQQAAMRERFARNRPGGYRGLLQPPMRHPQPHFPGLPQRDPRSDFRGEGLFMPFMQGGPAGMGVAPQASGGLLGRPSRARDATGGYMQWHHV